MAAAILDRLLHHRHTLLIQGDSYWLRQKKKKKAGLLSRGVPQATGSGGDTSPDWTCLGWLGPAPGPPAGPHPGRYQPEASEFK